MKYTREKLESCEELTVDYLSVQESALIQAIKKGVKNKSDLYVKAERRIKSSLPGIEEEDLKAILSNIENKVIGLGKLTPLIEREDITDIKILDYNNIRIKRKGTFDENYSGSNLMDREDSGIKFKDEREYEKFVNLLATNNKSNLANTNAEQIITDPFTSDKYILRIAIATNFVTSNRKHIVHIRKIPKFKDDLFGLEEKKYLVKEEREYLSEAMKKGASILVCGKGSAGKTTLINALLEEFPKNKAGLIIQESQELFSDTHPELIFLNITGGNSENDIEYNLQQHSVFGLKVDIDLFGIGEITGKEAYYFGNAAYTGNQVIGSIHAFSYKGALPKLIHYAEAEISEMLEDMDIIVYANNFQIREIAEVSGYNKEKGDFEYNLVFEDHIRINESCPKYKKKLLRGA